MATRYPLPGISLCAVIALGLCSCSSSQPTAEPSATPTVTVTATETVKATESPEAQSSQSPAATPSPTSKPSKTSAEPTCGTALGASDFEALTRKMPPARDSSGTVMGWEWDADYADTDTYDPCAALSWVTYPIEGATGSSPFIIALFHEGKYIGVATRVTFGFFPKVQRINDSTLKVTYTYNRGAESNADASGRAVSTYSWDSGAGKVVHKGNFPPGYNY